jgi:hypothetical protein
MLVLVRVQFERAGEGVGDGRAGAGLLTTLEPGVVVDAHAGKRRDFLPAQARGATDPGPWSEADVGRADLAAPGAQETAKFRTAVVTGLVGCHAHQSAPAGMRTRRPRGALSHPPMGTPPNEPPCRPAG